MPLLPTENRVKFGRFELDLRTRQLTRNGVKIRLSQQPVQVLSLLLETPGEIVTREEFRRRLWSSDVFVDFDHGLNKSIQKLRDALGDSAASPRYIETIPRIGYRFIVLANEAGGSVEPPSETGIFAAPAAPALPSARFPKWLVPWVMGDSRRVPWKVPVGGLVLIGLVVVGILYWTRNSHERWARNQALPEIVRLIDDGKTDQAFQLALRAKRYIPNDPVFLRTLGVFTTPISIQTTPGGADIYVRTYSAGEKDWTFLGRSPLENVLVPWDYLRLKIEKAGFGTIEAASFAIPTTKLKFVLDEVGSAPANMVRVPGATFQFRSAAPVELADYWLDKYEVTNRQFNDFMGKGGYQNRANWKHEFIRNGRRLSWQEALGEFKDITGRIAPSTWELGSYPDGQGDFPVAGVSWYEAAAYCESVGKSLPTVYHWYKAAGLGIASDILRFSNFDGKGPAAVGSYQGLGPYGTYDMAGNIKEWTWNETGSKRYILGGAWNESKYMFATEDARPPFDRSAGLGFRCAKYSSPPTEFLTRPIDTLNRDYSKETPVPDSVFAFYKSLYSYDHTELDPKVEAVDDTSKYWRRERVSFRAAYGNERVTAYLFLPRNARPPYATVIFFPGVHAYFEKSSENIGPEFDFVVRSGRALLYPIYVGTYERRITSISARQTPEEVVQPGSACLPVGPEGSRDLVPEWAKDIGRSIDYLETRSDIDSRHLGYMGLSLGAVWGPVLTAVEPRFKASVLVGGGLPFEKLPSEIEPMNFAPRVKAPTLMVNGQQDFIFPVESSQDPLFRLLGVAGADKRHVTFDSGHLPPTEPVIKESLDWLDRYLGPVQSPH
jgi:formylglycine-generating enzyme required for sulfatase activity/DNA-binding winged helix-turn-helix (wHTH) protein/pimeloyl-ACP methyl ester carboxylesterase